MNRIRKLVKDIDGGKNLERNLPEYADTVLDTYLNYSALDLTFSAYLLMETIAENEEMSQWETVIYTDVMNTLLDVLGNPATDGYEGQISHVRELRDKITEVMELYTTYTDQLICYDYVLKRMKLSYACGEKDAQEAEKIDEEELIRRIMAFLIDNKEKRIIGERLQLIMGMLPVHMTKGKLIEKVQGAATLYEGNDLTSLESYAYMIRSAAMLHEPNGSYLDEEVEELRKRLEMIEFSELDESSYKQICKDIEDISKKLFQITDLYYSMQKVINGMYALCLVKRQADKGTELLESCENILRQIVQGECQDEILVPLEGKIETYVERCNYLEAVLFQVKSSHKELLQQLGKKEWIEDAAIVANLLSDSLFIDIDAAGEEQQVNREKINEVSRQLADELSAKLATLKRPVKRAVTAQILEKLPVDFTSAEEVEEYIRTNLLHCSNDSEKGVVMLELNEILAENEEWNSI